MAIQSVDVVGSRKAQAFVGLSHQIADVHLGGRRVYDGIRDAMYQQVGDEAGEQRAGTDADDIGAGNGVERLRERVNIGRNEEEFLDANLTGGDLGFAPDARAILPPRLDFDVWGVRRGYVNRGCSDFP